MKLVEFFVVESDDEYVDGRRKVDPNDPWKGTPRRPGEVRSGDMDKDRFGNVMFPGDKKYGSPGPTNTPAGPSEFSWKVLQQQERDAAISFPAFLRTLTADPRYEKAWKKGYSNPAKWTFKDSEHGVEAVAGRRTSRGWNPDGTMHYERLNSFGFPTIYFDGRWRIK